MARILTKHQIYIKFRTAETSSTACCLDVRLPALKSHANLSALESRRLSSQGVGWIYCEQIDMYNQLPQVEEVHVSVKRSSQEVPSASSWCIPKIGRNWLNYFILDLRWPVHNSTLDLKPVFRCPVRKACSSRSKITRTWFSDDFEMIWAAGWSTPGWWLVRGLPFTYRGWSEAIVADMFGAPEATAWRWVNIWSMIRCGHVWGMNCTLWP